MDTWDWVEGCKNCDDLREQLAMAAPDKRSTLQPSIDLHMRYHTGSEQQMKEGTTEVKEL